MSRLQDSMAKMDLVLSAIKFMGTMGIYIFLATVALLTYWNFEKDPLTITDTGNNPEVASCIDRVFTFERYVKTTKHLDVFVARELVDLSTGDSFNLSGIPPYSGAAGERNWTYLVEVPEAFREGLYEYRPTLTYVVNPIKTITKPAPSQKVQVCGF
jgi:hypothetical protein